MRTRQPTTTLEDQPIPVRLKLAAAWTSFMFLYIYVDYLHLYKPGALTDILAGVVFEFDISPTLLTIFVAVIAIPALMVMLSMTLPARVNRATNLVVASLYIPVSVFNAVGESWSWSYFYGLSIGLEVLLLTFILRAAWTWPRTTRTTAGRDLPLSSFHVASPDQSAGQLANALARGKNLLLTPGVYDVDRSLVIRRDDTVVLGLGHATLTAVGGATPVVVRPEATGVVVAGVTIDAGTRLSPNLMHLQGRPGRSGDNRPAAAAPTTTLNDVYFRVGGPHIGKADVSLRIDADDVLIDLNAQVDVEATPAEKVAEDYLKEIGVL